MYKIENLKYLYASLAALLCVVLSQSGVQVGKFLALLVAVMTAGPATSADIPAHVIVSLTKAITMDADCAGNQCTRACMAYASVRNRTTQTLQTVGVKFQILEPRSEVTSPIHFQLATYSLAPGQDEDVRNHTLQATCEQLPFAHPTAVCEDINGLDCSDLVVFRDRR